MAVPQRVAPIDTTAAGDAFNAAYLTARLAGHPPAEAARAGHILAGEVIQHRGAIMPQDRADPGFPRLRRALAAKGLSCALWLARRMAAMPYCAGPCGANAKQSSQGAAVTILLRISALIDALNERVGRTAYWLVLASVLVSAGNAIVRYTFDVSSNGWLEMQWYLYTRLSSCSAPATRSAQRARPHRHHLQPAAAAQPRLDRSLRRDLLPAADGDHHHGPRPGRCSPNSYARHEYSPNAGGLLRWPVKLLIPVGFFLLVLQGLSEIIKRIAFLIGPHSRSDAATRAWRRRAADRRRHGNDGAESK